MSFKHLHLATIEDKKGNIFIIFNKYLTLHPNIIWLTIYLLFFLVIGHCQYPGIETCSHSTQLLRSISKYNLILLCVCDVIPSMTSCSPDFSPTLLTFSHFC